MKFCSRHTTPTAVRLWAVSATFLLTNAAPLIAQAREGEAVRSASIRGVIFDSRTRLPIPEATVAVEGSTHRTTTGRDGFFVLTDLEPGKQGLRVSIDGRTTEPHAINLRADGTTYVRLSIALSEYAQASETVAPIPLPPLEVEITLSDRIGKMRSYLQRSLAGQGQFITRQDLERYAPTRTTDILRSVRGLRIVDGVAGTEVVTSARGCALPVFLDGLAMDGLSPNDMHPDDIEVIEVYRSGVETPMVFRSGCGALVIWTRDPLRG